jgi:hypothetical protein
LHFSGNTVVVGLAAVEAEDTEAVAAVVGGVAAVLEAVEERAEEELAVAAVSAEVVEPVAG